MIEPFPKCFSMSSIALFTVSGRVGAGGAPGDALPLVRSASATGRLSGSVLLRPALAGPGVFEFLIVAVMSAPRPRRGCPARGTQRDSARSVPAFRQG